MAKVKIKGLDKLKKKLSRLPPETSREIADAINDGLRLVDRTAKDGMRSTPKKEDGASQAGKYPAIQTGDLIKSLEIDPATRNKLVGTFGSSIAHGYYLEFGTSRMAARPWLRPSYNKNKKEIQANIARATKKAIRNVAK